MERRIITKEMIFNYIIRGILESKGNQIAEVGKTGQTTGYHLHIEVRKSGECTNNSGENYERLVNTKPAVRKS